MNSKFKFDLQFFGGGDTNVQQIRKRDPIPENLTKLRDTLYDKIMPGVESFSPTAWSKAQNISDNATQHFGNMVNMIPNSFNRSSGILDNMTNLLQTGEVPTGITDKLNAGVNKSLQSSMGSMLNGLANRGVVNSSITSQGVNNLSQAAADAYNRNYMNTFNSILGGYGNALSGAQNNTTSLLNSINALGKVPSMAYEGAAAPLMPGYNFFKDWYSLRNSEPEENDQLVTQDSSMCITGDTLVTLPDGREIPVAELQDTDEIKTWDFDNGCLSSAPLSAFFKHSSDEPFDLIRINFEDGSTVGVIYEHLFFDLTLNKFIAVNADNLDFTRHYFAKVNQDGYITPVQVTQIITGEKADKAYGPQTSEYLSFLTNGFISSNGGLLGICNRFDFDTEAVCYDKEKKQADLEKYGRLDYDALKDVISKELNSLMICTLMSSPQLSARG